MMHPIEIDELTLYWLAGILEGEGSFGKGIPSKPHQISITLNMSDEDVVARVAAIFKVKYHASKQSEEIAKGWKTTYRTNLRGVRAHDWIALLYPMMGQRRQTQMQRALDSYRYDVHRALTEDQMEALRTRARNGESPFHLAKEFGISKTLAYYIKDGYTYKCNDLPTRGCSLVVKRLPSTQNTRFRLPPPAKILSDYELKTGQNQKDLHWLAGLLEGEGSFLMPSPSNPNTPIISIQMTDEDVIARVCNITGNKYHSYQPKRANSKRVYITALKGSRAVYLMRQLYPLMGERRQASIDVILAKFPYVGLSDPPVKRESKLTEEDVRGIKRALAEGKLNQQQIARQYGVSKRTISSINCRAVWRHVTIDEAEDA